MLASVSNRRPSIVIIPLDERDGGGFAAFSPDAYPEPCLGASYEEALSVLLAKIGVKYSSLSSQGALHVQVPIHKLEELSLQVSNLDADIEHMQTRISIISDELDLHVAQNSGNTK